MPNYGCPQYWEKRYAKMKEPFDWLEDYQSIKEVIEGLVGRDAKILMLGCGNANLSQDMYDDGYINIHNIDISTVVIEQMAAANVDRPGMTWEVMDVTDIQLPTETYDLAIDKSTIDALLCGDNALLMVAKMMKEVQRVLKTGGIYFAISYGDPESRMDNFDWPHLSLDVNHVIVGDDPERVHYGYLGIKNPGADALCVEHWEMVESHLSEVYDSDDEKAEQNSGEKETKDEEENPESAQTNSAEPMPDTNLKSYTASTGQSEEPEISKKEIENYFKNENENLEDTQDKNSGTADVNQEESKEKPQITKQEVDTQLNEEINGLSKELADAKIEENHETDEVNQEEGKEKSQTGVDEGDTQGSRRS